MNNSRQPFAQVGLNHTQVFSHTGWFFNCISSPWDPLRSNVDNVDNVDNDDNDDNDENEENDENDDNDDNDDYDDKVNTKFFFLQKSRIGESP